MRHPERAGVPRSDIYELWGFAAAAKFCEKATKVASRVKPASVEFVLIWTNRRFCSQNAVVRLRGAFDGGAKQTQQIAIYTRPVDL